MTHDGGQLVLKQFQRRIAELYQTLAKVRGHIVALDPETPEALGLYTKGSDLKAERVLIEAKIDGTKDDASFPPIGDLQRRLAREFDWLERTMGSGLLEERRQLVSCYVHAIKADPLKQAVEIGLVPALLSEMAAREGPAPATRLVGDGS